MYLFHASEYNDAMAGRNSSKPDQTLSDLEECTNFGGKLARQIRRNETEDTDANKNNTQSDESPQRSIRDMLDDEEGTPSVFLNRDLVEPETIINEERIVSRDDQLESTVSLLKPILNGNQPSNILLYGPAGTGKSLIMGAVTQQIAELCNSTRQSFGVVGINCQPINTLDQAVFELVKTVAEDIGIDVGVPETGVSTKRKFRRLYDLINEYYDSVIFVLDEVDLLVGRRSNDEPEYSELLYNLSRASNTDEIEGCVSVAALTNDSEFIESMRAS